MLTMSDENGERERERERERNHSTFVDFYYATKLHPNLAFRVSVWLGLAFPCLALLRM